MEQMKEEKDNEIMNITEKYQTKIRTLKTELNDGSQQIESLRAEKVNVYFEDYFTKWIKDLINVKYHHLSSSSVVLIHCFILSCKMMKYTKTIMTKWWQRKKQKNKTLHKQQKKKSSI